MFAGGNATGQNYLIEINHLHWNNVVYYESKTTHVHQCIIEVYKAKK